MNAVIRVGVATDNEAASPETIRQTALDAKIRPLSQKKRRDLFCFLFRFMTKCQYVDQSLSDSAGCRCGGNYVSHVLLSELVMEYRRSRCGTDRIRKSVFILMDGLS